MSLISQDMLEDAVNFLKEEEGIDENGNLKAIRKIEKNSDDEFTPTVTTSEEEELDEAGMVNIVDLKKKFMDLIKKAKNSEELQSLMAAAMMPVKEEEELDEKKKVDDEEEEEKEEEEEEEEKEEEEEEEEKEDDMDESFEESAVKMLKKERELDEAKRVKDDEELNSKIEEEDGLDEGGECKDFCYATKPTLVQDPKTKKWGVVASVKEEEFHSKYQLSDDKFKQWKLELYAKLYTDAKKKGFKGDKSSFIKQLEDAGVKK